MPEVRRFVSLKILTCPVSSLATSGDMFSYIQECQGLLYVQTGQTLIRIATGLPVASTYIIGFISIFFFYDLDLFYLVSMDVSVMFLVQGDVFLFIISVEFYFLSVTGTLRFQVFLKGVCE